MSGDPNVLYDGNHLDVLRRHVRDESIDLVYGVSSDPWWEEVMPLADPGGGSCRDGLGPDGVNGNMGAESTLAWLVAVERTAQPAELMAGGAGGVRSGLGRTRVTRLGAR